MGGVAWARDPPRTRAAGLLLAGIDLASALRLGSGIEWVLQHILQGHAVGPPPRPRPFGRAFPQVDPKVDVVLHQRAQERRPRAECGTFAQDQSDDVLHLCIGSIDHLARRGVDLPNGEREAQRPPARLLQGALIHALREHMELRLTHGAFSSQQ